MVAFFDIVLDTIIVAAWIAFVAVIIRLVLLGNSSPSERLMRVMALFLGVLIILGANAGHSTFAQYTVNSLSGVHPAGAAIKFLLTVVPGGVGVGLGWYITKSFKRNDALAYRILALVGMLAATSFIVIFAQTLNVEGVQLGAAILPNVAFLVGLFIYIIFRWFPDDKSKGSGANTVLNSLRETLRKLQQNSDASTSSNGDT